MIKTCLLGLGRTGEVIAETLLHTIGFQLCTVVEKSGNSKCGQPLSNFIRCEEDIIIIDPENLSKAYQDNHFKVAIDFTTPDACLQHAQLLAAYGVHLVIGTSGFNSMQLYQLKHIARQYKIGLVYAPNISLGINLLLTLAKTVARIIPHYDVEITETYHKYKGESPSGAALKIANAVTGIKGLTWKERHYTPNNKDEKPRGEIGIHSLRAGGSDGVHTILFAGENDEIEITHRAYNGLCFAEGALKAAKFIVNRRGLYEMEDVLAVERAVRDMRVASQRLSLRLS